MHYSSEAEYLLISDVDDTLTGDREAIKEYNYIISEKRSEFYLVYSSGRFRDSLISVIEEEGLIEPDALISNVGTEIFYAPEWKPDGKWRDRVGSGWDKNRIEERLKDYPVEKQPHPKEFTASYYVDEENQSAVKDIRDELKDLPVMVIHTKGKNLDILPQNAGKGKAALYLREITGLPLICCGDSENDREMLEIADFSILVGNAVSSLRKELSDLEHVYIARNKNAAGVIEGLKSIGVL